MAPACINYNIHTIKKLNSEDLIKVIEGFRSILININFLFHPLLHLFIGIYYNKSKPFFLEHICCSFNYKPDPFTIAFITFPYIIKIYFFFYKIQSPIKDKKIKEKCL
jgi:hypothetical protein